MNSKIRKRGPGPFYLILSVACLIGLIVLVWRSPETVSRISHALIGETKNPAPIATNENQEPSESTTPKKITKTVRNSLKPPTTTQLTQPDAPQPGEAQVVSTDPSNASVKTDSAVAYSFNSQRSPVVFVLKKGDTVERTLELVDSAGRWSLIRMRDSNRSAFVRSENLENATPLKSSTVK